MEQIETARKKLRSLPIKEAGKTRAEVAEFLVNDIKKAMRRGYTLRDIRDLLAEAGVSVPLARLREVLTSSDGSREAGSSKESEPDTAPRLAKEPLVSTLEAFPPKAALDDMAP
ncbi:hypothetical protein [uncultured Desulfovibrio sp.]|uniref:hypothetical protein n=1 Tax=uncultured Desulfovibrio sp. TaxID=167968 RepID=UPI002803A267|nr:hypothetical protein [uncultured Desulfovibrio sp.]